MSIALRDLFDAALLEQMIDERYVRTRIHPTTGHTIYNYTEKAQFERVWNDVTRACRGLIVDRDGIVVARPFAKFFNLGEQEHLTLPTGPVQVTDKLDGSLGILYATGDGHALATRGSFLSEQAEQATKIWQDRYAAQFTPNPAWTYLFEIIYPVNRIVVDYQGLEDIVLLAAIDTDSGASVALADASQGWPGPVVNEFGYATLDEVLAAPARDGQEGFVVHFIDADVRVKIKQDEYVRLHRIVTGVSERRIWEALSEDNDISAWLEAVPDEFHAFVSSTRDDLLAEHATRCAQVHARYETLIAGLAEGWTRKEFAAEVEASDWPLARALYLLHDGRPFEHLVWTTLRPEEHKPHFAQGEDVS